MLEKGRNYYLYSEAVDMRKGFNGLSGLVIGKMHKEVRDGSGYIFINKRRTHLKLLIFEGDGFSIYYKRLEKGTFEHPDQGPSSAICYTKLLFIMQGIMLEKVKKKKRYNSVKLR